MNNYHSFGRYNLKVIQNDGHHLANHLEGEKIRRRSLEKTSKLRKFQCNPSKIVVFVVLSSQKADYVL